MNDEIRMTNDETNPNKKIRNDARIAIRSLLIESSSFIRHSSLELRHSLHIRSGTLMPRRSKPRCKTRPVRSQSASRELRAGSSDFKTGQAS